MAVPLTLERGNRYGAALPFAYRRPGQVGDRLTPGWTRDLSERGAWVVLPEPLAVATALEVRFGTRADAPWISAQVAWRRSEAGCPGYHLHGVAFAALPLAQRHVLRALLASARPQGALRWYGGLALAWQRAGETGAPLHGRIRDLSEGGAAVWLPVVMPPGTVVRVWVETAFGTITAEAQVVWAEGAGRPRGTLILHGLRFLRLGMASSLPLSLLLAGVR